MCKEANFLLPSVLSRSRETGAGKPVLPIAGGPRMSDRRVSQRGIDTNRREFTFPTANHYQGEHIISARERLKPGSYR